MKIKNIGLAWISSSDLAKSKKFLVDTLGLEILEDVPNYNWMELAAADKAFILGVGKDDGFSPVKPGQNAVVTLTVDDLKAAKSELEAKGITVGEIVEIPDHVKMAFVQDPDGNYFHLVQHLINHR